jgi:hypothetical protein
MDTRIYEKGSRAEKLWIACVGLMFVLSVVWITGV